MAERSEAAHRRSDEGGPSMSEHVDQEVANDEVDDEAIPEVDFDDAAAAAEEPVVDDIDLPTALAQRDEYLALARQVQADFENFRKRSLKQQHDQASAATA